MYQPNQLVTIVTAPAAYPFAPGLTGRINYIGTDPVNGEDVYSVLTTERVAVQPRTSAGISGRTGGDLYECHGLRASDLRPAPDEQAAVSATLDAAGSDDLVIGGRGNGPLTLSTDGLDGTDRHIAEQLADLPLEELPDGAEDRVVDRARAAGLFDSGATEALYRLSTGGGMAPLMPHRDHFGRRTVDELRAWAREHNMLADVERAIEAGGGEGTRGMFEIGTAAGMPMLTWRIEPWSPEMDPYRNYAVSAKIRRA